MILRLVLYPNYRLSNGWFLEYLIKSINEICDFCSLLCQVNFVRFISQHGFSSKTSTFNWFISGKFNYNFFIKLPFFVALFSKQRLKSSWFICVSKICLVLVVISQCEHFLILNCYVIFVRLRILLYPTRGLWIGSFVESIYCNILI